MEQNSRALKIVILFIFIIVGISIFLLAVLKIIIEDRRLPRLVIEEKNRAIRGSIISQDGYQIAYSNKLYEVAVDTRCIDPKKKELFVNLFSIYSGVDKKSVKKALRRRGYVVLSYKLDTKRAYQLKILSRKFYQMNMFIPYRIGKNYYKQGLTITESGEKRKYPYKDILTPVVGYVQKSRIKRINYIYPKSIKGIEKYYDKYLKPQQNGVIRGKRDIGNNIILNKKALIKKRIDGYNVHLNVNLLLQKNLENILDSHKKDLEAREIIAAVMESSTGKLIAIATSNRYNPERIKDLSALNPKFIEYSFEPGSVIKPITFALLLEHKLVSPMEVIRGYNGRYKLGRKVITDEHRFDWLSAENVIVHSSNIGIAQLAQRLPYNKFYNGLKSFGFGQRTGIDLPYEKRGSIVSMYKLKSEIYKATVGYGYSIRVTFMQLLKAYNVFNNEGFALSPKIASFLTRPNGKRKDINFPKPKKVVSSKTASIMRDILKKVVQKGTGTVAKIEGLEIGGKTGTAHMVKRGKYVRKYNSSFFGFANDKKHRYTIGVTVIEPKLRHFASQTAVPVFREIVMELVNEGYLSLDN